MKRTYQEMKQLEQDEPEKTYKEFVQIVQGLVHKRYLKRQGLMYLYWIYALTGIMPTCEEIKSILIWGEGYYY